MGRCFNGLSRSQQTAVAEYVREEHSWLISVEQETYIVRQAKANAEHWQESLCELIASDPKRVQAIVETAQHQAAENNGGFTLIELSIVLVIIGLIVGGVLVGQDLIRAAGVRAQITQIEKFNTAANTFYGKYGYLPGDMPGTKASQFGFYVGTNCDGHQDGLRNGNGIIFGGHSNPYSAINDDEPAIFWQDLSSTAAGKLIEGTYQWNQHGSDCVGAPDLTLTPGLQYVGSFMPPAKIGRGNFVYVYTASNTNWYGLSAVTGSSSGVLLSNTGITVREANDIDRKVDDGFPTTGNVVAVYLNNSATAAVSAPSGASDSATTCYNSSANTYSLAINGGSNVNCALSFRFQ